MNEVKVFSQAYSPLYMCSLRCNVHINLSQQDLFPPWEVDQISRTEKAIVNFQQILIFRLYMYVKVALEKDVPIMSNGSSFFQWCLHPIKIFFSLFYLFICIESQLLIAFNIYLPLTSQRKDFTIKALFQGH